MTPSRSFLLLALTLLALGAWWIRAGAGDPGGAASPELPLLPAPADGAGRDAPPLGEDAPTPEVGDRSEAAPGTTSAEAGADSDAPAGFRVHGRCLHPAGHGLAGVRVSVPDGETVAEATSDGEGRFDLGRLARPGDASVELADHELMHRDVPRPVDGELELTLVLAPVTALEVRALDASGRPVEGLAVRVTPSSVEPHGRLDAGYREYQPPTARAETDAEGLARVPNAAADMRLRVRVGDLECEWVDPGTGELREGRTGAAPIVLRPGAPRALVARFGPVVRLRGRVLEEDGSPAAGAVVNAVALDLDDGHRPARLASATADAEGRFELRSTAVGPVREVLVTALSMLGSEVRGGMFGGRRYSDPRREASERVALDPEGRAGRELLLQVSARSKLGGRVVDPGGEGRKAHVTLLPLDPDARTEVQRRDGLLTRRCADDGTFLFPNLAPGRYDVVAHDVLPHDAEGSRTVLRGVEGGRTDLELVLEPTPRARVHVEVRSALERRQTILLVTRLMPAPGVGDDAPVLAPDLDLRAPRGWPEPALGLWYGAQTYRGPLGEAMFSSGPMATDSRTLELVPGLYWIGAKGSLAAGGRAYPMGTGLVRVRPGEHHLRLHLEPEARLEGRVLGATPEQALCVALATPDGHLVPLDVRAEEMREACDLSAAGTFVLPSVPSGTLELRVGTYEQLRAGGATLRRTIEVPPGETRWVELGG